MSEDRTIEERNQKTYIAEYSAPKIEVPDLGNFKTNKDNNLANQIKSRLTEIQKEYDELVKLYEFNAKVEGYAYSFVPTVGHVYYMYTNEDRKFISLISPKEFTVKYQYDGKCRCTSGGYFEQVIE